MAKYLVIVESPAKAKTIKKFLGNSYKIEASMGHLRDLPKSQLGVDIENDFEPKYIAIRGKGELIKKLRTIAKSSDKIFLATDPDREGEAISWHLTKLLNLEDKKTSRITFNEVTEKAVKDSVKNARKIDMDLVDAQQARRILDRIVGYKISPILWKKVAKGLSAGRVQSVALRLICDREEEIEHFITKEYWSMHAQLCGKNNKSVFESTLYSKENEKVYIDSEEQSKQIMKELKGEKWIVSEVKKGEKQKKTVLPFTTSTLQQTAFKVLGFSTQKTMKVAQQLYEGLDIEGEGFAGLITYMRTDSTRISEEAKNEAAEYITDNFGKEYVINQQVVSHSKAKTQDAHEAIRVAHIQYDPEKIKDSLTSDQYKLYKLIWKRFIASQMASAKYDTLSVKIKAGKYIFKSTGSIVTFEGFMKVYNLKEDTEVDGDLENQMDKINLKENDELQLKNLDEKQHFTQPPARFTEATLVKALEENGVGRPSTYSPTITTIVQRRYITKENKSLYPTELGQIVNEIMEEHFNSIVDIDFTAQFEEKLDKVAYGEMQWKEIIRTFYVNFEETLKEAEETIGEMKIKDEETDIKCEKCGRNMVIKNGRFGKFLACPGFPDCRNARPIYEETDSNCPKCNAKIVIKKTKKGRLYYACEKNPECDFMSWNKPTSEKCPVCNDILVEKGRKTKKIVCNNTNCNYQK